MQKALPHLRSQHHDHRISLADFIFQGVLVASTILCAKAVLHELLSYAAGIYASILRFAGHVLIQCVSFCFYPPMPQNIGQ